jgi:CBS domain-containing protein
MRRDSTVVKPGDTLEQLVDEHILGAGRRSLIVAQNGNVVGLLTLHDVKEIPRSDWPTTTSAQAMIPAERMKRIQPDAELADALKEMARDGINQLPVMVGDQLQGVLGRDDVISMLRTIAVFSRQQN